MEVLGMLVTDISVQEPTLASALSRIEYLTSSGASCPAKEISDILATVSVHPFLFKGINLGYSDQIYVRNHIHSGTNYSFLALTWLPKQGSPIHSHKTWCAFSIYQGYLTETLYRQDEIGIDLISEQHLFRGDVRHSSKEQPLAHKLRNNGTKLAVSLHVYGAPFDRLGSDVNYIWNEEV
jgi:predicted metal-dependent enzyme (double-stranded beta helix superfamily)